MCFSTDVLSMWGMDTKMIDQTIAGLRKAPRQLREIALETGVSESWLSKFKRGCYDDPSSRRVERVYRCLIGRGLVPSTIDFSGPVELNDCA